MKKPNNQKIKYGDSRRKDALQKVPTNDLPSLPAIPSLYKGGVEMQRLGDRNYSLLSMAVKSTGTFNPKDVLPYVGEELYVDEIDEIEKFLQWMTDNGKTFGSGNYEEVFAEFRNESLAQETGVEVCGACGSGSKDFNPVKLHKENDTYVDDDGYRRCVSCNVSVE